MDTTEEWAILPEYPGYRVKSFQHEHCKITILRPILDEPERKKIESYVKTSLEGTLRQYYARKEEQHEQHHN